MKGCGEEPTEEEMPAPPQKGPPPMTRDAAKALSTLASTNQVTQGLKAGAEIAGAIGELTGNIAGAVDQARKTSHQINRENGALELEILRNAAKRADDVANVYDKLRHERWWKYGKFYPTELEPRDFGISKDEIWAYENNKPLNAASKQKLMNHNKKLRDYVLKIKQLNDDLLTKTELRQLKNAERDDKKAELEFRKTIAEAKKEGADVTDLEEEIEDNKAERKEKRDAAKAKINEKKAQLTDSTGKIGKGMSGSGYHHATRPLETSYLYPNPDMMSGLMSK